MEEMTSLERVRTVLAGKMPDRLPVIPQSFLFCAATAGYQIGEINRNPAKMAEAHIMTQEKFGYDGCIIDVDDAALAEACGASVLFREDGVAVVDDAHPALRHLNDIDSLKLPNPFNTARLPEWLETTERIVEGVGDHVFIMGRADQGPFNLLCLLRGAQDFMMDLITEDSAMIQHALEWTTKAHILFANAMYAVGAHATSMGDSYASPNLISPRVYSKYALPCEIEVVKAIQKSDRPYSIHICGNTSKIVKNMGTTGAKILEVDWQVDMGAARAVVPENTVLMGNINPSDPMFLGTPDEVLKQSKAVITSTKGKGLILSSGCALGPNTKPENVAALVSAAKLYGSREELLRLQS